MGPRHGPDFRKAGLEQEWERSSCRFYAERDLSSESRSSVKGTRAHRGTDREQTIPHIEFLATIWALDLKIRIKKDWALEGCGAGSCFAS